MLLLHGGHCLWPAAVYKVLQQYVVLLSLLRCKAFWCESPSTSGWGPYSDDTPSLSACGYHAGRRKRSASKLHPGQEGVFCGGTAVIITANIGHTFLRGQHCSIYLTCTCSYDCPCSSVRDGCCYDPFYRWRYRGTGRLSSLPEVTQPARSLGSRLCRLGAPQCSLTLCLSSQTGGDFGPAFGPCRWRLCKGAQVCCRPALHLHDLWTLGSCWAWGGF